MTTFRRRVFWVARGATLLLVLAAAAIAACDDDDNKLTSTPGPDGGSTKPDSGNSNTTTATISGEATYNGTKTGPLIIAVFKDQPVPGQAPAPPIAVASNETPTWPGTNKFTVNNVPTASGTVWVAGFINVGPDHRQTGAGLSDPIAMPPKQVTVTAGQTASVSLTLGDRPIPDGGTDGGDGGGGGDDGGDAGLDASLDADAS